MLSTIWNIVSTIGSIIGSLLLIASLIDLPSQLQRWKALIVDRLGLGAKAGSLSLALAGFVIILISNVPFLSDLAMRMVSNKPAIAHDRDKYCDKEVKFHLSDPLDHEVDTPYTHHLKFHLPKAPLVTFYIVANQHVHIEAPGQATDPPPEKLPDTAEGEKVMKVTWTFPMDDKHPPIGITGTTNSPVVIACIGRID